LYLCILASQREESSRRKYKPFGNSVSQVCPRSARICATQKLETYKQEYFLTTQTEPSTFRYQTFVCEIGRKRVAVRVKHVTKIHL